MIQIYGKPDCPYCVAAKQLAESKGIEFDYKTLNVHFTRDELLEKFPRARTFPQIEMNGEYVGGFTELKARLSSAA